MPGPPRLKDRLFTALCVLAAVAVAVIGLSRGNGKAGLIGAAVFLGYAALQVVTRRLTPAARLLTGNEADDRERLAQFRATRLAGQVAMLLAGIAALLTLTIDWGPGPWVAGACGVVLAGFVGGLWRYGRLS